MARQARGKSMDPAKVQVFHTVQRCVRRAFLCGEDAVSGKSYDHRKQWIRERLEFLASVFGIDLLTYTVMSNHLHLVLRSRPDVVADWSNQEVVIRGKASLGSNLVFGFQPNYKPPRGRLNRSVVG